MNDLKLPEIPKHLESLLSQLKNYPVLVIKPVSKNKVNILQVIQNIPFLITKTIFTNLDKNTAEEAINLHNNIEYKKLNNE